jgi:hypothetical protein
LFTEEPHYLRRQPFIAGLPSFLHYLPTLNKERAILKEGKTLFAPARLQQGRTRPLCCLAVPYTPFPAFFSLPPLFRAHEATQ